MGAVKLGFTLSGPNLIVGDNHGCSDDHSSLPFVKRSQKLASTASIRTEKTKGIILPFIVLVACISGLVAIVLRHEQLSIKPSRLSEPEYSLDSTPKSLEKLRLEELYNYDVKPILERAKDREDDAVARATKRVDELFSGYRNGLDALIEDLTTLRTKARIAKTMVQDAFDEGRRTQEVMQAAFAEHLFSEERLAVDVRAVICNLQEDLDASRNKLLSEVRAAALQRGVQTMVLPNIEEFSRTAEDRAVEKLTEGIRKDMAQATGVFALSTAGGLAAELVVKRVVQQLVVFLTARMGAVAATAGGATAASAAGGATLGSWIPGPGTIAGVIAGLIVGGAIDHYMSENAKQQLHESLSGFVHDVQRELMDGPDGLRQSLRQGIEAVHREEAELLRESILEGSSGI